MSSARKATFEFWFWVFVTLCAVIGLAADIFTPSTANPIGIAAWAALSMLVVVATGFWTVQSRRQLRRVRATASVTCDPLGS